MLPVLGVIFALPILSLAPEFAAVAAKVSSILLITAIAAILFRGVRVFEQAVLIRFDISAADNLRARKVYTQIHVISKVLDVIIGLFTTASVLMLFAEVRHVGTSLLTSAGVVGIVVGVAAQKTIANLFAGFQIALAQPVRQDDVVIVEGEWGRVEETTLTYIVVHIWDDRRLVVPLSYFIEKPFQNWTRASAQLLGSIYIWVDYTFPVADGRKALKKIIESSALWDKRFWNLQVTDAVRRPCSCEFWRHPRTPRHPGICAAKFENNSSPTSSSDALPQLRTHLTGTASARTRAHDALPDQNGRETGAKMSR